MIIKNVNLETVCGITSAIPDNLLDEVAFAGKSNVGKSSLINALMNRRSYARTSSQPGKTQTINFYHINDAFYYDENGLVRTKTNNAGGILGGITTGMPILFCIAVKPTPSIGREQHTVDLTTKTNADLTIHGRHDPCIVPRAIPVAEAAAALALMDLLR